MPTIRHDDTSYSGSGIHLLKVASVRESPSSQSKCPFSLAALAPRRTTYLRCETRAPRQPQPLGIVVQTLCSPPVDLQFGAELASPVHVVCGCGWTPIAPPVAIRISLRHVNKCRTHRRRRNVNSHILWDFRAHLRLIPHFAVLVYRSCDLNDVERPRLEESCTLQSDLFHQRRRHDDQKGVLWQLAALPRVVSPFAKSSCRVFISSPSCARTQMRSTHPSDQGIACLL